MAKLLLEAAKPDAIAQPASGCTTVNNESVNGRRKLSALTISGKVLGSRRPLFADWSVPFPPEWDDDSGGGITLRDVIDRVVRAEVKRFQERQEDRQLFRALSAREIEAGVAKGKIEAGGSEVPVQKVDADDSVAIACQAFEDGLFLVIIDGNDHRELDAQVYLQPDSQIAFVRLTLLAGG